MKEAIVPPELFNMLLAEIVSVAPTEDEAVNSDPELVSAPVMLSEPTLSTSVTP